MLFAKLIVIQPGRSTRELEILDDWVSIGRAPDNTVALEGDTNVSRHHAEIERRDDEFYLRDLGSSNGTTVNSELIGLDHRLRDEDLISVGGSTLIEFHLSATPWPASVEVSRQANSVYPQAIPDLSSAPNTDSPDPRSLAPAVKVAEPQAVVARKPASIANWRFIAIGVGGGLLITGLAAVLIYSMVASRCNPTARIVNPPSGTTVDGPITIRVDVAGEKCIDRLIYQLDGQKLASSEVAPYSITLDPEKISGLDAGEHLLSVTVEDRDGSKNLQPDTVLLAFETGVRKPAPESARGDGPAGNANRSPGPGASTLSSDLPEIKEMAAQLARRINSKSDYVFDPDFLQQVQSRISQYTSAPLERARAYHDVINEAFVGEQGLPASLGYVMALSRSRFIVVAGKGATGTSGAGLDEPQGLWRIQPSLAQGAGYLGRCGPNATLAEADQKCAAMVASAYLKALVWDLFRGEFVYAVATFGMPSKEAARFRDQLPNDRRDFWKVIRLSAQRDRVVNFFAAGIVGENPQKFGLGQSKSLTSLY